MRLSPGAWGSSFDGTIREIFAPNAEGVIDIVITGPRREAPMKVQVITHYDPVLGSVSWIKTAIQVYVHDAISVEYSFIGTLPDGPYVGMHIYHRAPPRPVD